MKAVSMRAPLTEIAVSYRREWADGFGARGWKLDCALDDRAVIAATAETGTRIQTSVLVHDILDHYLCGLPLSGHRNEARALYQLAIRTGSDPTPDFAQMVDEDLLQGRVNGEHLQRFLPAWLSALAPKDVTEERDLIAGLEKRLGKSALRQLLVMRFVHIGAEHALAAMHHFEQSGLEYSKRNAYGNGLQRVMQEADDWVLKKQMETARGLFVLNQERCALRMTEPELQRFETAYD
jgi:hypothetical protein